MTSVMEESQKSRKKKKAKKEKKGIGTKLPNPVLAIHATSDDSALPLLFHDTL